MRSRRWYLLAGAMIAIAAMAGVWWTVRPVAPPSAESPGAAAPADRPTPSPPPSVAASFVGSEACAGCHDQAYAAWKDSHHARAMQHATPDTVLGNFAHASFRYAGVESTFFQRDGKYFVHTDGADGKLKDFEIKFTFGVDPLQQYLIEFPDGRIQALSIAWDSRPAAQGGQRWFHLYPNDRVDSRDELHWTRYAQNWNFMCADCHSTDVHKNYDPANNTFHTTYKEISVGCEACHGPGSAHLEWARSKPKDPTQGLTVNLTERKGVRWSIDAATGKPTRSSPRDKDTEIQVCAQCHARHGQIADGYRAGLPFLDFYRPALLSQGLYYVDGQQRDEVYVWGSFLQSRMYHAGVTCGDCHEPHGQKLRAAGNALCGTCHQSAKYDTPAHHHHAGTGRGTRCVDCHMPERTYMIVNPRRDHSIRIPRPDLTDKLGVPNACSGCHAQTDAQWAAQKLEQWYGHRPEGFQRYAEAFAYAAQGAAQAGPSLTTLALEPSNPAIARASALEALARYPSRAAVDAAQAALVDPDALLRLASVGTLAMLPPVERLPLLAPLLEDPVRIVRMEAASTLADAMAGASATQRASFDRAAAEYESSQRFNADRPESRAALGNFYARQGRIEDAEAQLRAALALDRKFAPGYVNLSDLLRAQRRDAQAEEILRDGLKQAPGAAALHYALGLTLVRLGRSVDALAELKRAAKLAPDDARFAYVYAVGLNGAGKSAAALAEIERALAHEPDNRDLLNAAITFRRDSGDAVGARRYAERMLQSYPDDPDAKALMRELGGAH
ncbi:MAG TPA: tetratricopeptide repeat protein [Steroidobacteraceae bacterium]|nr:tetratricopeptide repeat protein [Steroidobacteraceae bacterium]